MAKRIFWKIWSVIASSLAVFGADVTSQAKNLPAATIWQLPAKKSEKPDLFLEQSQTQDSEAMVAGHRSHSSHASHRSHYSGTGSQSPVRETPESSPAQTPKTQSPATRTAPSVQSDTAQKVHMKNGVSLDCESAWQSEGKLFFNKGGKTYSLPLRGCGSFQNSSP